MCSTADKFDFANPSTPLEKALVEVLTAYENPTKSKEIG